MISRIRGMVLDISEKYAIIDVGGLGYKVFCAVDTLAQLAEDTPVSLHTYLCVREDALDLYGFGSGQEKDFFEILSPKYQEILKEKYPEKYAKYLAKK